MPSPRYENYRNYVIAQVPWRGADWHPERCNACSHNVDWDDPPTFFYDIQDRNHNILNEDVTYCSTLCCRTEIDARMHDNHERPYTNEALPEMQEEETED